MSAVSAIGIFAVKVVELPERLWEQVPGDRHAELAAALTASFGDRLVDDFGLASDPTLDETIPTSGTVVLRRIAFQFESEGVPLACFAELTCCHGGLVQVIATCELEKTASERAVGFVRSVRLKPGHVTRV
jgi:hypothetical protein